MIVKEFFMTRKDGVRLFKTFSTENLKIRKLGSNEVYDTAIDIENAPYTYVETNEPVEEDADLGNS